MTTLLIASVAVYPSFYHSCTRRDYIYTPESENTNDPCEEL